MKFISFFVAFLFVLVSTLSYSQSNQKKLEAFGDTLSLQGRSLFFANKLDSAAIIYLQASEKYFAGKHWNKYVGSLNDVSSVNYYAKQYDKFYNFVLKANEEAERYLGKNDDKKIMALSNLNTYYYTIGDFSKAVSILQEVLTLQTSKATSKSALVTTYSNLGTAHLNLGDYSQALSFFKKSFSVQQDTLPNQPGTAIIYRSIGKVFNSLEETDSTIYYYEKAKELFNPVNTDNPLVRKRINNYLLLAELWSKKNNYTKANEYIRTARSLKPNEFYLVQMQETMGKMYLSQEKYPAAIEAFKEGQKIANKNNKRNTPPLKARRLMELAKTYILNEDKNKALETYQEALKALAPEFESDDLLASPSPDQLLSKSDALDILERKAKILRSLYATNQEPKYLEAAYNTYQNATQLIQNIRQGFANIESKNTLSEKTIPIYEGAIQCALDLFQLTKKAKFKAEAFELAERNKALLLLESLNEQTAKGFAGIPDSLLNKEKELKLKLTFLKKTLLENKNKGQSVKKLDDQIFEAQQKIDQLIAIFEKDYPRYFELKYQNEPITVQALQKDLIKSNAALVEFFVGENNIYQFVISKEQLEVFKINNPEAIGKEVEQLRKALTNFPEATDPIQAFQNYSLVANSLYKKLFESLDKFISEDIQTITIIPDDLLSYIPFDILLCNAPNIDSPGYSLTQLEYLMERYSISYQYSATLLHKSQQRTLGKFKDSFVGFAPIFKDGNNTASRSCTANELYNLQYAETEVQQIYNLLNDGQVFINEGATKDNFEKHAINAKIIHLATHACIDEQDAAYNKIFFTNDYVSNFDLYNLELNAELAVLSACNTGTGKLIKGEGVMSLARGFINAGCSSSLMSMWSVDDNATSTIMVDFYKNLSEGASKDEALRSAKLHYLNTTSKTNLHPYYWAAFVPFGDMDPIESGGLNKWIKYLGGALLIFFLVFFFVRKKR